MSFMAKQSRKKTNKDKARVLSSRVVYRGPAFNVTADQVREPSGVRTRRDIVHHSGSVVILAVDDGMARNPTFCWNGSIVTPPANALGTARRQDRCR